LNVRIVITDTNKMPRFYSSEEDRELIAVVENLVDQIFRSANNRMNPNLDTKTKIAQHLINEENILTQSIEMLIQRVHLRRKGAFDAFEADYNLR
jgi:pseudouridine-5'-phosphate glycosidase